MNANATAALIRLERHTLPNGLRVVLAPDPSVPVVAVNLWYAVGSRNEEPGRTGFAHLFEHMMFQGSAHVPKNGHFELIERAGGTLNATTWFDRTNYFETLPAHELDLALWLEADRMGWMLPAMTEEKLENQRDVVKNERRQRYDNQPYGDWDERMQSLLFPPEHPYHHTVIGSMEDISAATLDDVHRFFATYYVPNNAVLTVCGDIDPPAALASVERYFGDIERGATPPPIPGTITLPYDTGGTLREDVVGQVPLPRVYMAARVPPFGSDDYYVGQAAVTAAVTGRSSRVHDRLVRRERLAKSVSCSTLPLTTGVTMLLMVATGYDRGRLDALEAGMAEELDRLGSLERDELDRAVAITETRTLSQLQRVGSRADLLSMFATLFDDPDRLNRDLWRLRDVTLGEVEAWAGDYMGPSNRAVVRYIPEET